MAFGSGTADEKYVGGPRAVRGIHLGFLAKAFCLLIEWRCESRLRIESLGGGGGEKFEQRNTSPTASSSN